MTKKTGNNKKRTINTLGIELIAVATPQDEGPGSFHVVNIKDIDRNIKTLLMPRKYATNLGKIKSFLIDNRFPIPTDAETWRDIKQELCREVSKRAVIMPGPGFIGDKYLLANNVCIGPKLDKEIGPFFENNNKLLTPIVEVNGTLSEWQKEVALPALCSSRLVLSLCSAISSYVSRCAEVETGGFHLYGTSSIGKTTSLNVAVSVQGPEECKKSWSLTEAGLENMAAGYNDALLALDEIRDLDENQTKITSKVRKYTYKLTSERGKTRSTEYMVASQQRAAKWCLSLLSTGEYSLSDNADEGGEERLLGEEVRLVDVPADAGKELGIFESLPKGINTPNELAEKLNNASKNYYGIAQHVFLEEFTQNLHEDRELVTRRLKHLIDRFLDEHQVSRVVGHEVRLAKRFALAYAAGRFAINYKVLPYSEEQIMEAISCCYLDAVKTRVTPVGNDLSDARKVLEKDLKCKKKYLDIRQKGHGFSKEQLKSAWGFKAEIKGRLIKVLPHQTFEKLICDTKKRERLLDEYISEERLLLDSEDKKTRTVPSKIKGFTLPRAYCFLPPSKK